MNMKEWVQQVIKPAEIEKYLVNGKDFIDEKSIFGNLEKYRQPDKQQVRDILQKSLDIKLLSPEETAVLLNVEDPGLLEEMREAALQVKKKVYDNRIVFFAPLYCSNLCVNSCVYCGFRSDNCAEKRHVLTMEEVRRETEAVIDEGEDDPTLITQALGAIARSRNLSAIARQAGMSREGLYKALSAGGNPTFATVVKVARALGLRVHFESVA